MKASEIKKSEVKKEVNGMNKSPFFWLNSYNRASRKQTAIDGLDVVKLTALYKTVNSITGKGFTFDVLPQNSKGQICKLIPAAAKSYKGGELINNFVGEYELQPVSQSNYKTGLIDAIFSYLEYRKKVETDLASKKEKAYTKKELFGLLKAGEIDEVTFVRLFENAA